MTPTAGKEEFYKKAGFKYKPNYNISCDELYRFMYTQKKIYNYHLKGATEDDTKYLIDAKLYNIFCYAHDLAKDEVEKINSYVKSHIPKQIVDYQMIYVNNNIIGCVFVENKDDGVILEEIYIEDNYRNKGIGTNIIKNIISKNDIVYLWVYKENINAINLYKKLGFIIQEETDIRYYMKHTK